MLLDIATEELSHLEMVGQMIVLALRGSPPAQVDEVESGYLGDMLEGRGEQLIMANALMPGEAVLGGGGPRLTDSAGNAFTAAWVDDPIGQPVADLQSDIAAEGRAKIVYERLIKYTDDPGASETLMFLMTREVAHQKMFEAALHAIADGRTSRPASSPATRHSATCTSRTPGMAAAGRGGLRVRPAAQRMGLRA